ncbi:MAG: YncE family protein [Gammaproteobacteria bacterium]
MLHRRALATAKHSTAANPRRIAAAAAALYLICVPVSIRAETILSANDATLTLIDGKLTVRDDAHIGSVSVIRLRNGHADVQAEVEVPTSVLGPPFSVAMTPNERLALVTAPLYIDPQGPASTASDDVVSIIDLEASPPQTIGNVRAGTGAAGVSITPDGTLALVANRRAGTVSVLAIEGRTVRNVDTVPVGNAESGVGHVAISPDGKRALVTRDGDNTISVLGIDGRRVTNLQRDFGVGLKPYGAVIARDGRVAIVANVSMGRGDDDTLSVIDMLASPVRVVGTVTVGQTPEGLTISPDGKWCAVALINGSNKPRASPFHHPEGKLVLLRIEGLRLERVAEHPIGAWPQGAVFGADSRTLLVGSMSERNVSVFRVGARGTLTDTGQRIALRGGNAALRAIEPATGSGR